ARATEPATWRAAPSHPHYAADSGRPFHSPDQTPYCGTHTPARRRRMARVTGIGGVFFKSKGDHKALAAWYQKHLGIPLEPWGGAVLRWPDDGAEDGGLTVWNVAKPDTAWFAPSDASFMINYRVDDLDELLADLRAAGVEVL